MSWEAGITAISELYEVFFHGMREPRAVKAYIHADRSMCLSTAVNLREAYLRQHVGMSAHIPTILGSRRSGRTGLEPEVASGGINKRRISFLAILFIRSIERVACGSHLMHLCQ